MKQRLLSLVAVVAISLVAMAQRSWTPPALTAADGTELRSSETDTVYLYNVGAAQFLIGGTAWGTHAALGDNALPIRLTSNQEEAWTIYFFEGSKSQKILGRSTDADLYIDYNNQAGWCTTFTFTKKGDYYRIQSNINDPNYGQEAMPGTYIGQVPSRDDYDNNNNVISQGVGIWGNVTEDEPDAHIDWLIIPKAIFKKYNEVNSIKRQLLDLINTAEEVSVDVTSYVNLLDNSSATVGQVEQAITDLKAAIVDVIGDEASEDNPVNVTSIFIVNPDFDGGSTQGWTLTGAYAKTQNNNPHPIEEGEGVGEEGLDASPGAWLEFWKSGGIDADQDAHQVVSDLPAGSYRLQLVGCGQGGKLYAITNGIRQEATIPNGKVQRISFDFIHVGGDLTFGFDFKPASGNTVAWVAVDKFRLYYLGQSSEDETLTMLRNALNTYDPYLTDYKISEALYEEAVTVQTDAQALVDARSDDADANTAAINAINAMTERISKEATAYSKLNSFINNTIKSDLVRFDKSPSTIIQTLYDKLEEYEVEFQDAYDEGKWNEETINQKIEEYNSVVSEALEERKAELRNELAAAAATGQPLAEPLDITGAFDAMTFPNETITSLTGGYPADDPQWKNETATSAFKVSSHTGEVWNVHPFNVYREFTDLPKGKYTIKAHAFYRVTANADNYAAYMAGEYEGLEYAYIYAGNSKKHLINLAELTTTKKIVDNNDVNVGTEEEPIYIINNQVGANRLFTMSEYAALAEKTYISVSASVLEDGGTLRAGFAGTEDLLDNSWVVFDGFELFYEGVQGLDDDIQGLLDKLATLESFGVEATETLIEEAKAAGEAAIGADQATQAQAINKMESAIEASALSEELTSKIFSVLESFQIQKEGLDPEDTFTDTSFDTLLEQIDDAIGTETFESNEQLQGWMDGLPIAWCDYVLSKEGIEEASEENPIYLPILVNGTFDDMVDENKADPQGWTCIYDSKDGAGRVGIAEFWSASTFDIYQDLPKLKEGYYSLSLDGFYRAGGTDDELSKLRAGEEPLNETYLYAGGNQQKLIQWSDTERGAIAVEDESTYTALQAIYDAGDAGKFDAPNNQSVMATFIDEEHGRYHNTLVFAYGVDGAPAGAIRIGLKKLEATSKDWCPFDNFRLEYLGTKKPTGVIAVETAGQTAPAAIFTLDGRRADRLSRGVNIIRQANGQVVKVLVK